MRKATSIPRKHILSNKKLGHHVSMAKGISNAILNASEIGATSFALFTRSPRTWKTSPLSAKEISKWKTLMSTSIESSDDEKIDFKYQPEFILPHGSYLTNLGHNEDENRQRSFDLFLEELQICEKLGIKMLNIHPGSTRNQITRTKCIELIAGSINEALKKIENVKVVLENTAGGGGTIGISFEELKDIIELIEDKSRIGICLDTCHMFAAGYDISTKEKFNSVMALYDKTVGMKYLCGMHLNDCKSELGSNLDRHEKIGKGKIGMECFRAIMNDPRFDNIPLILETPGNDHKSEIALLYSLEKQEVDIETIANSILI